MNGRVNGPGAAQGLLEIKGHTFKLSLGRLLVCSSVATLQLQGCLWACGNVELTRFGGSPRMHTMTKDKGVENICTGAG